MQSTQARVAKTTATPTQNAAPRTTRSSKYYTPGAQPKSTNHLGSTAHAQPQPQPRTRSTNNQPAHKMSQPVESTLKRRSMIAFMSTLLLSPLLIGGVFYGYEEIANQHPPPGFLPLERMTSNLDGDLRAQISLSIETPDAKSAVSLAPFVPKLRSSAFLATSSFSAARLLTPAGKTELLDELMDTFRTDVGDARAEYIQAIHFTEFVIGT